VTGITPKSKRDFMSSVWVGASVSDEHMFSFYCLFFHSFLINISIIVIVIRVNLMIERSDIHAFLSKNATLYERASFFSYKTHVFLTSVMVFTISITH